MQRKGILRGTDGREMGHGLGAAVEIAYLERETAEIAGNRAMLDAICELEFEFPSERFSARGIVICGGGERYLPSTYVLVRLLRRLHCELPIEVWHLGKTEMPETMRILLAEHGAVTVDAQKVRRVHPTRRLAGWELKCYALLHSAFEEVLLLDADNCPVRDPSFLFETSQYWEHGAIFWPDYTRFFDGQAVWLASGVPYRDEPEFESGQIVVDKRRCWRALNVAMHLNEHSDWWYRVIHGDKDTFHLAWRKIGQDYAMPEHPVLPLDSTMLQYDFEGRLLFQHRNFAKWRLEGNRRIKGFKFEKQCLGFLKELAQRWTPCAPVGVSRWRSDQTDDGLRMAAQNLIEQPWHYERKDLGGRALEFLSDGTIGQGREACERWWTLRRNETDRTIQLEVFGEQGLTFRARAEKSGRWRGAWVAFEKCAVILKRMKVPLGKKEDPQKSNRTQNASRLLKAKR